MWELQLKEQLLRDISNIQWKRGLQDKWHWLEEDLGEYTVKSGYKILNKEIGTQNNEVFELIWSLMMPPSVAVCLWRLVLDTLPTKSKLSRRGVVVSNLACPMRLEGEETSHHLFFTCRLAQGV